MLMDFNLSVRVASHPWIIPCEHIKYPTTQSQFHHAKRPLELIWLITL